MPRTMIDSILIANRGEIGLRILRTCREMGIRTVAVFSDADAHTPLVAQADSAVRLGPAPAAESYLNVPRLLKAAAVSGARAIHPGYGFLAENPEFSRACRDAGLIFIGPPPEVIEAMGDKARARQIMEQAGLPVLPGYGGGEQEAGLPAHEAEKVGYPLLVKAVAGGGGRGIRLVEQPDQLTQAIESARREAEAGFGDGRLMLEKFLPAPRHVEFQIMADNGGRVLNLFERECSIQRRRQKVIEESPSPALDSSLREAMGEAAVKAATAAGYIGAGTVEFLLEPGGKFYFLEMNTRIQVEHPITEMRLGLDIVRLQIEVAAGLPLTLSQDELRPRGHAIECRLNAEEPARGFLPGVGTLRAFDFPSGQGLRVDTGYAPDCEITPHYDSLLAKLVSWGEDREEALRRMGRLLREAIIAGPPCNISFLQAVLARPEFISGEYTTLFVEQNEAELVAEEISPALTGDILAAAAVLEGWLEISRAASMAGEGEPAARLWGRARPWRTAPGIHAIMERLFTLDGKEHTIEAIILPVEGEAKGVEIEVTIEQRTRRIGLRPAGRGQAKLREEGQEHTLRWHAWGATRWLVLDGRHLRLSCQARGGGQDGGAAPEQGRNRLLAPLPGKVALMRARPGMIVKEGELLAVVEAMKMEHPITAPFGGKVGQVHFAEGDPVEREELLLELEPED